MGVCRFVHNPIYLLKNCHPSSVVFLLVSFWSTNYGWLSSNLFPKLLASLWFLNILLLWLSSFHVMFLSLNLLLRRDKFFCFLDIFLWFKQLSDLSSIFHTKFFKPIMVEHLNWKRSLLMITMHQLPDKVFSIIRQISKRICELLILSHSNLWYIFLHDSCVLINKAFQNSLTKLPWIKLSRVHSLCIF